MPQQLRQIEQFCKNFTMNCFYGEHFCHLSGGKIWIFTDFAKVPPPKHIILVVFSARKDDQSKERINLPGVTLFDFCRISCRSGGKKGVPPHEFHSRSSVATVVQL